MRGSCAACRYRQLLANSEPEFLMARRLCAQTCVLAAKQHAESDGAKTCTRARRLRSWHDGVRRSGGRAGRPG
eukprot:15456148-Alexandrium_andersonii.AAC.1